MRFGGLGRRLRSKLARGTGRKYAGCGLAGVDVPMLS